MTARAAAIVMVAALVVAGCAEESTDPPPLITAPATSIAVDTVDEGAGSTTESPTTAEPSAAEIPIEQVDCPAPLERDDGFAL
ncbi:MAG TPA: hypothetical protein VFF40_12260, partial [Acidimicrobiia bacterium]|nr:hypothetical protein [Acidimicrobiia bacterium]